MTLKERILGWFKKEEKSDDDTHEYIKVDWTGHVDKDAVEGKTILPNIEDYRDEFEKTFFPKKAIWGGKPTKAFMKWMKDNNF